MGNNLERHQIIVEGMSCGHCKAAVEKAVRALTGVELADVDLAARTLVVEFDGTKTTLQDIKTVVDEEGYTVV
ncbi:cation transporter [Pelosinus sp. sgz500959]|uniref:cation transporter n=1 Tax=Pelosinus sp. sgz500959 TaxID=3242472 RepID=UPI00366C9F86